MSSSPLEDMIAGLETQLVQSVHRAEQAAKARLYTEVLELEQRIERLQTALAIIADRLASEG
jgi:primosomal protein N''